MRATSRERLCSRPESHPSKLKGDYRVVREFSVATKEPPDVRVNGSVGEPILMMAYK